LRLAYEAFYLAILDFRFLQDCHVIQSRKNLNSVDLCHSFVRGNDGTRDFLRVLHVIIKKHFSTLLQNFCHEKQEH